MASQRRRTTTAARFAHLTPAPLVTLRAPQARQITNHKRRLDLPARPLPRAMSSHVFARSLRAVSSRSLSTGNKASAATFAKLDFNSDGVLSRGEVVGGARRFNLTAEEAGALFDRLDKNEDNGAARENRSRSAGVPFVAPARRRRVPFASWLAPFPTSRVLVPTPRFFSPPSPPPPLPSCSYLPCRETSVVTPKEFAAHAAGASVASRMSFSSPESDFSAPLVDELFQSLDLDGDGQLSRDEVATGAHRFGEWRVRRRGSCLPRRARCR